MSPLYSQVLFQRYHVSVFPYINTDTEWAFEEYRPCTIMGLVWQCGRNNILMSIFDLKYGLLGLLLVICKLCTNFIVAAHSNNNSHLSKWLGGRKGDQTGLCDTWTATNIMFFRTSTD